MSVVRTKNACSLFKQGSAKLQHYDTIIHISNCLVFVCNMGNETLLLPNQLCTHLDIELYLHHGDPIPSVRTHNSRGRQVNVHNRLFSHF